MAYSCKQFSIQGNSVRDENFNVQTNKTSTKYINVGKVLGVTKIPF
jgi:hypothetical protein